jgi:hypothetical protein
MLVTQREKISNVKAKYMGALDPVPLITFWNLALK